MGPRKALRKSPSKLSAERNAFQNPKHLRDCPHQDKTKWQGDARSPNATTSRSTTPACDENGLQTPPRHTKRHCACHNDNSHTFVCLAIFAPLHTLGVEFYTFRPHLHPPKRQCWLRPVTAKFNTSQKQPW